jgi:hypothetical protein
MVYAFDQIRSAIVLYSNLNLAPTAISARATFENYVNLNFIINGGNPELYADRYNRFRNILRLKAHRNSQVLGKLSSQEEAEILSKNPDWIDNSTGKIQKKVHWTAIPGMNLEQLTQKLDISDYYSIYRSTSQFIHASPITSNLYNQPGKGMGVISSELQARRMSLMIALFALETLKEFCNFYEVGYDKDIYLSLVAEISRLSNMI